MQTPKPKDCLIVEDHKQARLWLRDSVVSAFDCGVRLAETVGEAESAIDQQVPDLALVDLSLPDGNGIRIIRKLAALKERHAVTIVVTTAMNTDDAALKAISAGADGYLLKEEAQEDLIDMLSGIVKGKPPLSNSIAVRLLSFLREDGNPVKLAPREQEVLQQLALGKTVPQVAAELGVTQNTAASYVKSIYRKLNVNSRAEAALEASKRGLV